MTDPAIARLLESILAEVAALRVAMTRHVPDADSAAMRELLAAAHEAFGDRVFTSRELLAHASLTRAWRLLAAIGPVVGTRNPARALGVALGQHERVPEGGLAVFRVGDQSNVALWKIREVGRVSRDPNP